MQIFPTFVIAHVGFPARGGTPVKATIPTKYSKSIDLLGPWGQAKYSRVLYYDWG
jgi:hypothetical protein